jgi:uncharacterized C2H2 Zn-finger protein
MQKLTLSTVAVLSLCFCVTANAADAPELKCPVSGHPASKEHAVKYKDGEVYLCCDKCPAAFKADTKKYAVKANEQLVSSGQYKQVKCPLSGEDINPAASAKVAGINVAFCCDNCKGKVAKLKGKARADMVFSDAAFAKAFEKNKDAAK